MQIGQTSTRDEREIAFGANLPPIPERLLLAHARGEVLFICGAGVSMPANLPDFRRLVIEVYEHLDTGVHTVLETVDRHRPSLEGIDCADLTASQLAEALRFVKGDYDVVLGMLERRLDNQTDRGSRVRQTTIDLIRARAKQPAPIHKALMRLANRGGATAIVTTNFDRLLEIAGRRIGAGVESYALGSIPRPMRHTDWSGVMHIHGMIDPSPKRHSELVISDQDFGEFYLRRRAIPDFIYDAARLYHLVLVGYSANDPPMRYLLNAVAADGQRFDDLKERFTFFGTEQSDPVALEDWKARHITPIPYSDHAGHQSLCDVLERWADLSAITGDPARVEREIRRIVKRGWNSADDADRDLFAHLFRRGNTKERAKLAALASQSGADIEWLNVIAQACDDKAQGGRS